MTFELRQPEPVVRFDAADNAGEVVLVIIGGHHPQFRTAYGVKPASRVTVVMLTGRHAGTVFDDVMFFGDQSSQFRDMPGGDVALSRIVARGKGITYEPGSAYDGQLAAKWISDNPTLLDELRGDAVRNFREQSSRVAERLAGGGPVASSPQFQPTQAPPNGGDTMSTLREPNTPADPNATGY